MRKIILLVILNIVFTLFQESFLLEFFGSVINPNLILCLGYAYFFANDTQGALISLLLGGFFIDMSGTGIVGITSVIMILVLLFSIFVRRSLFKGAGIQALLIIVATVVLKMVFNFPELGYSNGLVLNGIINVFLSFGIYYVVFKSGKRFLSVEYRIKA